MPTALRKNNVTVTGNAEALKTIVFGHGFGTDQTAFGLIKQDFEKEYRILLYDNVGSGLSDPEAFVPAHYNTLDAYAADLEAILDEDGAGNIIYIGHSVSGMIGLITAIKRPELFERLVLLAPSPRYLNDPEQDYTGGFTQQALDDLYEAMRTNYQAWASGFSLLVAANPDRPKLAETFAATLNSLRPDVALAVARTIFQSDYRKVLPKINRPVLLVHTREDMAVPRVVGEYLQQHIPGSILQYIDATGHLPHLSAPDAVTAAIRSFI